MVSTDQRRTALLRHDGIPLNALIAAIFETVIPRSDVTCMQVLRRPFFKITMKTPQALKAFAATGLTVNNKPVTFRLLGDSTTTLLIKDLPYWVRSDQIKRDLEPYGIPASEPATRELHKSGLMAGIENGDRSVVMKTMPRNVPNLFVINGFKVQVFYPGVIPQCFTCLGTDHMSGTCPRRKKRKENPPPPETETPATGDEDQLVNVADIPQDIPEALSAECSQTKTKSYADTLTSPSKKLEESVDQSKDVEEFEMEDQDSEVYSDAILLSKEVEEIEMEDQESEVRSDAVLLKQVNEVTSGLVDALKDISTTPSSTRTQAQNGILSKKSPFAARRTGGSAKKLKLVKNSSDKSRESSSASSSSSSEEDENGE